MSESLEEIYRWACGAETSLQRAVNLLARAKKSMQDLRGLCKNQKLERAQHLKAKMESRVLEAIGICIDPDIPGSEAEELAMRVLDSQSILRHRGHSKGKAMIENSQARIQERSHLKGRVDTLAHEILTARGRVSTDAILRHLADAHGWDASRVAKAWADYLETVFKEGSGASISQKREAMRLFANILGPAPEQKDDDFSQMSDEELERVHKGIVRAILEAQPEDQSGEPS